MAQYLYQHNEDIDKIIFMPAYQPPHKEVDSGVSASHRYNMIKKAIEPVSYFNVSSLEIEKKSISYTIDTIMALKKEHGVKNISLLIGEDSLKEFITWKKYDKIMNEVHIFVFKRFRKDDVIDGSEQVSYEMLNNPLIELSSTYVRQSIRQGQSIRYYLPENVVDYIHTHNLYRGSE